MDQTLRIEFSDTVLTYKLTHPDGKQANDDADLESKLKGVSGNAGLNFNGRRATVVVGLMFIARNDGEHLLDGYLGCLRSCGYSHAKQLHPERSTE